jgi:hypothetical protein
MLAEDEIAVEEGLRWGWMAAAGASVLWDLETAQSILLRQLQSARDAGLLVHLLVYLNGLGICDMVRPVRGSCFADRGG